jgi:hypothetical protein
MNEMNDMPGTPEAPKKNNTTIIIAVVVVVLLCCCCITAVVGWQYGDTIVQSLGL